MRTRIEWAAAVALAAACQGATPREADEPVPRDLLQLRDRIRSLDAEAASLKAKAHGELDRGRYEDAAALHRRSVETIRQAERLRASEEVLVADAARKLLEALTDDDIAVREAAARDLLDLKPSPTALRSLTRHLPAEAAILAEFVLRELEETSLRRQWASEATASAEYSRPGWAAAQATGPPDTPLAGDHQTAWASREPDGGTEWLVLTFDRVVFPTLVRVHETYNAGAIVKVELKTAAGSWRTVWEGEAAPCSTPRWFEARIGPDPGATREIRLTLDSAAVPGWNEIDAVELIGRDPLSAAPR